MHLHPYIIIGFFVGCLHDAFKNYSLEVPGKNVSCTMPWIQSMLGVLNYNATAHPTCNKFEDFSAIDDIGLGFAREATTFGHKKCPGKYTSNF